MPRKANFHHELLNHGAPNNSMHPTAIQLAFHREPVRCEVVGAAGDAERWAAFYLGDEKWRNIGNLEMDTLWKPILWGQFGASIDMLENALLACPDELWGDRSEQPEYWYLVYHTLFWLDLYLSGSIEGFSPPAPFTLDELDPAGLMPERVYGKGELHAYLRQSRQKCRAMIESLTDEKAKELSVFGWGEVNFAELLLYNMRHVQHHAAQLNLILRQKIDSAPGWVAKEKESYGEE